MKSKENINNEQKGIKIINGFILLFIAIVLYFSSLGLTITNCPDNMRCTIYERVLVDNTTYQTLTIISLIFAIAGMIVVGYSLGRSFKKYSKQNHHSNS